MNIGERQRKLYLWSKQRLDEPQKGLFASQKDLRLFDLYHLVYESNWLRAAHDRVAANAGSKTAGCDGITMADFDRDMEGNLRKLAEELRTQTFAPYPARRTYIPKKNGKLRPLGIPSVRDRIVQEALRMVLEPIFEAEFYELSYGFRPNRSTHDALARIIHMASNSCRYFWVVEGDIKSYFDTIHHRKLMQLLRRRIRDRKLLRLVWRFLKAGVMEGSVLTPTDQGTPQGGIISPLLANVYLHELDMFMGKQRKFTSQQRKDRRSRGVSNVEHIRYADDFVVMCNGDREQAEAVKQELHTFLSEELKLTLSEEKTKITHVDDGFRFLGFDITRHPCSTGIKIAKFLIPNDVVKKVRATVQCITAPGTCNNAVVAKIGALNRYLRGWGNYYRHAFNAPRVFSKLDSLVFWQMAHWLGRKFKCQIPRIMRRFYVRHDGRMTLGTDGLALWRLSQVTFGRLRKRIIEQPYATPDATLKREEQLGSRPVWYGTEKRPGIGDLRRRVMAQDKWMCRNCGKQVKHDSCEIDHIKPVSRFSSIEAANRLENLQTLCLDCHIAKTQQNTNGVRPTDGEPDAGKLARPVRREG